MKTTTGRIIVVAMGGLALFGLMSGSAVAGKQITGADVADDSLTGADVLESSLGVVPF